MAQAILEFAEENDVQRLTPDQVKTISGKGVQAFVQGVELLVGSRRLLEEQGVFLPAATPKIPRGCTGVYTAVEGRLIRPDRPVRHPAGRGGGDDRRAQGLGD